MTDTVSSSTKKIKEIVSNPEIKNIETRKKSKSILFYIGIIIFIVITFIAIYSSYQLRKIKNPAYQQEVVQKKIAALVTEVSKIMELPEGIPQSATVSDVEALKKTEVFFIKAQNGDEVLIYTNQAILYRPTTHKIINVTSINRDVVPDTAAVKKDIIKTEADTDNKIETKIEKKTDIKNKTE